MITPRNAVRVAAARKILQIRATQKGIRPITVTAIDTYKGRVLEEAFPPIADLLLTKNPTHIPSECTELYMMERDGQDAHFTDLPKP